MRKLKLLFAVAALIVCGLTASAETDYTSLMSSDWSGSNGSFGGGKERYQGSNYEAGKIMYQSFTAPAAGIYEIKFYAVTSSTSGRGFNNIYGDNIAQAYATAGNNKAIVAMTVINQTGCTLVADANIRTLSVEAAEGETIEYGLENIATGGNWYTIKELSAKMKTVAEIFQAQYDEALAIYNNSTENEEGAKATFKTYVDAMQAALTGTLAQAQEASNNLAAALVIYESKSYPVKGSGVKYDFTDKMNMAINAWTCVQGNGPAQYGFTGATETYGVNAAGEVMYQIISGLANGEYEIHFYAVANAANGGGTAGSNLAYVYANDQTLDIDVIQQNSCTPSDYERTFTVMVNDGTIKYGITNHAVAGNWYICKNVSLYMTGAPDLSDYYDAIAEKLTIANSIKDSKMNATVLTALNTAITNANGYEDITIINTLDAISNGLTTAISNANTSIANYEAANTIINAASTLDAAGQASYTANETVTAITSEYNNSTLVEVTAEQQTACAAALRTAAKAQTTPGADMTLAIVNPNIDGNANGWTTEKTVNGNGPMYGNSAFEYWSYTAGEGGFDYYQIINDLPAGKYTISAEMFNDQVDKEGDTFAAAAGVYGMNGNTTVFGLVTVQGATPNRYTTDEITVTDGILRLGVKNQTTAMPARWFVADNFKLTFVKAASVDEFKESLLSAINNANDIADKNVGTAPFQISESANNELKSAISTAQNIYDNSSATIAEVENATSSINEAIEAFNNAELVAPAADQHFNLVVTTNGHAKNGNAVIIVLGTSGNNNPTGYGLNANFAPNANLAQAVTFTQVTGNKYNLSFETADGTAYLTYGTTNGSAAGWKDSQIQATTDATKKGEFKIAATTTDNVFNIINTLTNTTIDCQTTGNIYTENGNTGFSVIEATQATVNVSIAEGVKYGTRIFPFTPTRNGVTFYSCAASNGNTLTLAEVEEPAANTPYILYAENGIASNDLTGWGTAAAETYTVGLLTGVYKATLAPVNSYVLQNNNGKVGFYQVEEGRQPTVGANRCYLTETETPSGVRAFFFPGKETTAIEAIDALTSGKAIIFNAAGAQIPALQKGINIIKTENGDTRKVMVK